MGYGAGRVTIACAAILACLFQATSPLCENKNGLTVIDTFTSCIDSKTSLPCDWHATRQDVSMFSLQREEGDYFVKIKTQGGCTAIGKRFSFEPVSTPYLQWRWRAHILPERGKENEKEKADSGAGVYVIFSGTFMLNKIIKYVWSTTLPQGTKTESPYNSHAKIVVLRSGKDSLGIWIKETVNVLSDYTAFFSSIPPEVIAIGIISDADNTNSSAEADYDDYYISKYGNEILF